MHEDKKNNDKEPSNNRCNTLQEEKKKDNCTKTGKQSVKE